MRKSPRKASRANKDLGVYDFDESNMDANVKIFDEKVTDSLVSMEALKDQVDDAYRFISQRPKNSTMGPRVTCHRVFPTPPADIYKRVLMIRETLIETEEAFSIDDKFAKNGKSREEENRNNASYGVPSNKICKLKSENKGEAFSNDNIFAENGKSREEKNKKNASYGVPSNKMCKLKSGVVSEDEDVDSASSGELFEPTQNTQFTFKFYNNKMMGYPPESDSYSGSHSFSYLAGNDVNGESESGPSSELFKKAHTSPFRHQDEKVKSSLNYDLKSDFYYESCSGENDEFIANNGIDSPLSSELFKTYAAPLSEEESSDSEPNTECGSGPRCGSIYGPENSDNGEDDSAELKMNVIGRIPFSAREIRVNIKVLNAPHLSVSPKQKPTNIFIREFKRRGVNTVILKRNGQPRYEDVSIDTSTIENQILLNSITSRDPEELVAKKAELAKTPEPVRAKRSILRSDRSEVAETSIISDRAKRLLRLTEDRYETTKKRKESEESPTTSGEFETANNYNRGPLLAICAPPSSDKNEISECSDRNQEDTFAKAKKFKSGAEEICKIEKCEEADESNVERNHIFSDESYNDAEDLVYEGLKRVQPRRLKSRKITLRSDETNTISNRAKKNRNYFNGSNENREETNETVTAIVSDDSEIPECVKRKEVEDNFISDEKPDEKEEDELGKFNWLYSTPECANNVKEVKDKFMVIEERNLRDTREENIDTPEYDNVKEVKDESIMKEDRNLRRARKENIDTPEYDNVKEVKDESIMKEDRNLRRARKENIDTPEYDNVKEVKDKFIINEARNLREKQKERKVYNELEATKRSYDDGTLKVIDKSNSGGNIISKRAKRNAKDKPVVKKHIRKNVTDKNAIERSFSLFDESDDENYQSPNHSNLADSLTDSSRWLSPPYGSTCDRSINSSRYLSTSYRSTYQRVSTSDIYQRMGEDDLKSCKIFDSIFREEKNERNTPPPSPTDIFGVEDIILPEIATSDDLETERNPPNVSPSPAVARKKRVKADEKKVGKKLKDSECVVENLKNLEPKQIEKGVPRNFKVDHANFENLKNPDPASEKRVNNNYSLRNNRALRSTKNAHDVPAKATSDGKNNVKNQSQSNAEGNVLPPNKVILKRCRKCNLHFSAVEFGYHVTECDIHSQE